MTRILLLSAFAVAFAGFALAQDKGQEEMQPSKPGAHHEHLKAWEGTWDATVKFYMDPTAEPVVSKGAETNTMACGGLWLMSDVKGDMMGQPFHGHGVFGYDEKKKMYVSTWVDNWATYIMLSEGSCEKDGKVHVMRYEGPDMTGEVKKWKHRSEMKDKDSRVFKMFLVEGDKEILAMQIDYLRKK